MPPGGRAATPLQAPFLPKPPRSALSQAKGEREWVPTERGQDPGICMQTTRRPSGGWEEYLEGVPGGRCPRV